jgi:hypothetical protein
MAPMPAAALLAKTGATMGGLAIGCVAYQQTASAIIAAAKHRAACSSPEPRGPTSR